MNIAKRDIIIALVAATISGGVVTGAWAAQPRMDKALEYLRSAREVLQNANANKGGHRVKAIKLIDQAIQEVRLGKVIGSS